MASGNCPSGDAGVDPPKHSNGHASPLDLLRRFHKLQTDRVCGYDMFEEAFTNFLSDGPEYDFPTYKQKVADITISFKRISEEVIHIKNSLHDTHNKVEISGIIEKIQELEEKKLKQTADYQIARKNLAEEADDESSKQEVANLRQRLEDLAQEITDALDDLKFESEDLYAQEIDDDDSLR